MKKIKYIKTVSYLVIFSVVTATVAMVPAERAEAATVSSYSLVKKAHGPRSDSVGQFNKYFVVEGLPEIGNEGGHIDISSKDGSGKVIATHRFQWRFSRDASYLRPDPNNNLTVHMAVAGTATGGTNHFMKEAGGGGLASNFWDTTDMYFAETWSTPNERVYENKGWRTHEFHVWEYAYFQYTAIGFVINLWSPADYGQAAIYEVCYLYEDSASAHNANVEAQVNALFLVNWPANSLNSANCGGTAKLWAQIQNTGNTALPSDASVWFYVMGPGVNGWVGSASVADMQVGDNDMYKGWRSFDWQVPSYAATGTYTYYAIVYSPTLYPTIGYISPWSHGKEFTIVCQ